MALVYVRNGDIETAIRIFTEKCKREGILKACIARESYMSKGDKKRAKAEAAKQRGKRKRHSPPSR